MSSAVFITNKSPSHEYSPAAKFGAITFVTMGNFPIFKTQRLQEEVIKSLVNSRPDDYLLLSGSSVIAAMCLTVWLHMHGKAKMLLWDRTQNEYVLRVIDSEEIVQTIVQFQDNETTMPRGA